MHFNRYAGLGAVLAGTVPNSCMISYTVRISICSNYFFSSRWDTITWFISINNWIIPQPPPSSATAATNDRAARGPISPLPKVLRLLRQCFLPEWSWATMLYSMQRHSYHTNWNSNRSAVLRLCSWYWFWQQCLSLLVARSNLNIFNHAVLMKPDHSKRSSMTSSWSGRSDPGSLTLEVGFVHSSQDRCSGCPWKSLKKRWWFKVRSKRKPHTTDHLTWFPK